jgi:hypothetical protein
MLGPWLPLGKRKEMGLGRASEGILVPVPYLIREKQHKGVISIFFPTCELLEMFQKGIFKRVSYFRLSCITCMCKWGLV